TRNDSRSGSPVGSPPTASRGSGSATIRKGSGAPRPARRGLAQYFRRSRSTRPSSPDTTPSASSSSEQSQLTALPILISAGQHVPHRVTSSRLVDAAEESWRRHHELCVKRADFRFPRPNHRLLVNPPKLALERRTVIGREVLYGESRDEDFGMIDRLAVDADFAAGFLY